MKNQISKSYGLYWVNDVMACLAGNWVDYLDEVLALGNVDTVHVDVRFLALNSTPAAEAGFAEFLWRAALHDLRVIVGLSWTFLSNIADEAVWASVLAKLHTACDGKPVYAFYFDEPNQAAQSLYLARTASLRSEFPASGVFATLQPGDVDVGYQAAMFEHTTDLGLDFYPDLYYSNPYPEAFAAYWTQIERLAIAGQKLWIVPPFFIPADVTDPVAYRWELYDAFAYFSAFAASHAAIEGLLLFLYSPFIYFYASLRDMLAEPSIKTLIKGVK